MKIIGLRVLKNANVFSYKPALAIKLLLGAEADTPSSAVTGFAERLAAILPGLAEHKCSVGRKGGFLERMREGTYPAHIFEHVLLELQNMCGDAVAYGKARASADPAVYDVVAAYRHAGTAKACAYLAEQLLNALLGGRSFELAPQLQKICERREKTALGPSAAAILAAAERRGIPAERFEDEDLLFLGQGKYRRKAWSAVTDRTSLAAADLVSDKFLTAKFLRAHGVPTPRHRLVETVGQAIEAMRALEGAAVFKPLNGSHGRGVTVGVANEEEAGRAFAEAARYGGQVLIEEYVAGRQYRLCVVGGVLTAAAERIPAYVIGDGKHTVRELVARANENPLRGDGHDRPLTKIQLDAVSLDVLTRQSLTPQRVPEERRVVKIKETANISTGGTAVDVTEIVHPDNVRLAEYAAKAIGLDIAGLDVIAADISRPLAEQNGAVIEVNAGPGLRMHHHPSAGARRDVGGAIVDFLFPDGRDGRIPLVAVTGTNGKTTTVRLIGAIFRQAGYRVGMSTTEGVFVDDECLRRGDCSGPASAAMVLAHPEVEAAILETARGGIVRAGLGFNRCDVGVLTNISDDHLGQDGIESTEDLAYIKSLVLEVAAPSGAAVINAEDRFAGWLAARTRAAVIYFSSRPDNILVRRHLGIGGKAVFLRDGWICFAEGTRLRRLARAADLPVTCGGLASHHEENALAAAAAAFGYGIADAAIRRGLIGFANNVGRLNIFTRGDFRVCVDYGHNLAGYQAVIDTARRMRPKRLVGVIAAPGDRRDDAIIALGEEAGKGFDRIYIKEDEDSRGRKRGEVAALLAEGARRAGLEQEKTRIVLGEKAAVRQAEAEARAGDFIVIFYESYAAVMEALREGDMRQDESAAPPAPWRKPPPQSEVSHKNLHL